MPIGRLPNLNFFSTVALLPLVITRLGTVAPLAAKVAALTEHNVFLNAHKVWLKSEPSALKKVTGRNGVRGRSSIPSPTP